MVQTINHRSVLQCRRSRRFCLQALYALTSNFSAVRTTGLVTLLALGAIAVGLAGGTFPAGVLMLITEM